ncbi:sialin-like [Antedon mediterranea]|uniref:sialin-like n=1 Tax=Antedon mediterranea TaxID=105859 RepID=UPI003AF59F82
MIPFSITLVLDIGPQSVNLQRSISQTTEIVNMKRYLVAVMCSMVTFCFYCMRLNLNIAIVEMIKTKNSTECDNINGTVTTETSRSKEFDTEIPTYAWDEETRQMILSSFYYGYTVTAFPGGWLACRVGGKPIIFCILILSSILTALIPWSAGVSSDLLIVLRVLDGMVQGLNKSALVVILGKWTVPHERSILVTIAFFGFTFSQVICNPISAWICSYKFGGWPLSFYIYSTLTIVTAIIWVFLIYETPDEDPFISSDEVEYLKRFDTEVEKKNKKISVPLLSIAQSSAVWAVVIVDAVDNFGFFFIITEAPTFVTEILGFDLEATGWITSSLGIVSCCFVLLSGACADFFIRREYLSILQTRKLFAVLGIGLPSFLLSCMEFFKQSAVSCLILLMLAFGIFGCTNACITPNVLDITKHYSGVLVGVMTTLASCSAVVGPTIIGELTKYTNTFEQWSLMFKIVSGVMLFGLTIFLIFAKAEEQFPLNEHFSKQEMKSYRTIQSTSDEVLNTE